MTEFAQGYTVSAETALRWVKANQAQRPDGRDRYMVMERHSKGGWGVWDCQDQCWVYISQ